MKGAIDHIGFVTACVGISEEQQWMINFNILVYLGYYTFLLRKRFLKSGKCCIKGANGNNNNNINVKKLQSSNQSLIIPQISVMAS